VKFVVTTEGTQKADKVIQQLDELKAKAASAGAAGAAGMEKLAGGMDKAGAATKKAAISSEMATLEARTAAASASAQKLFDRYNQGLPPTSMLLRNLTFQEAQMREAIEKTHGSLSKATPKTVSDLRQVQNALNLAQREMNALEAATGRTTSIIGGRFGNVVSSMNQNVSALATTNAGLVAMAVAAVAAGSVALGKFMGVEYSTYKGWLNSIRNETKNFTEWQIQTWQKMWTDIAAGVPKNAPTWLSDPNSRHKNAPGHRLDWIDPKLLKSDIDDASQIVGVLRAEQQAAELAKNRRAAMDLEKTIAMLESKIESMRRQVANGGNPVNEERIKQIEKLQIGNYRARQQQEIDAENEARNRQALAMQQARAAEMDTLEQIHMRHAEILATTGAQSDLESKLNRLIADRARDLQQISKLRHLSITQGLVEIATTAGVYAKASENTISASIDKVFEDAWKRGQKKLHESNETMFDQVAKSHVKRLNEQTEAGLRPMRELARMYEQVSQAFVTSTEQAIYDLFSGQGIKGALSSFADSVRGIMAQSIGASVQGWMNGLMKRAGAQYDDKGNLIGFSGGSTSSKVALSALQVGSMLYGLYQNGQQGVSRGQNAMSGLVSGAATGAQIGKFVGQPVVGAIVGGVIGGIAGWFTGSSSSNKDVSGIATYAGGRAYLTDSDPFAKGVKNMTPADVEDFKRKAEAVANEMFNAYQAILLKLPVDAILNLNNVMVGNANPLNSKGLEQWLAHELSDGVRELFEGALRLGFVKAGLNAKQFDRFLAETDKMDARDAARFWSDLADGLASFNAARDRMVGIRNTADWGSSRMDANGQQQYGRSDFEASLRASSKGIFDIARQMVSLTGPDKVAAFKALGASVEQVTRSLADYLARVGNALRAVRQSFGDVRLERALEQLTERTDADGNVTRQADPNGQARLLEGEYNRISWQIQNAKTLGLSPEDVEGLSRRGVDLLGRIYDLDPSEKAYEWWQAQMDTLEAATTTSLTLLGQTAIDAVEKLISNLQPFVDWFNGLPVDLDAAFRMLTDGALPGFAEALDALANRIRNIDLTKPSEPTNPRNPGPGEGEPGEGEGRGGKKIFSVNFAQGSIVVHSNNGEEVAQAAADAVYEAILPLVDSVYA
jgi:hypothetical protein